MTYDCGNSRRIFAIAAYGEEVVVVAFIISIYFLWAFFFNSSLKCVLKSSVSSVSSQSFSHCATSSFSSFSLVHSVFVCVEVKKEREIVSFYAQNKVQKRNEREEISNLHVTILNMLYIIPSSLNSSNSSSHSKSTSSFCFFLFCCSFARVSLLLVLVMTFSLLLRVVVRYFTFELSSFFLLEDDRVEYPK